MTVINTMEILTNLFAEMSCCITDRQRLFDISRFFLFVWILRKDWKWFLFQFFEEDIDLYLLYGAK